MFPSELIRFKQKGKAITILTAWDSLSSAIVEAAGADVVQLDEPYMQARPNQAKKYAVDAINRALENVKGMTVRHKTLH